MTRTSRIDALSVCGLAILAGSLFSIRIGSKSVWLDEAASVTHARGSFGSLVHVMTTSDPNQALYYLVLYPWVGLFGESEAAIRSLSAVFGVGAVLAIYLVGRELFGPVAGFLAGLLLATDPFFVRYAQEARGYTLVALLVTLSSLFFVRELTRPSRVNRVAYVVVSVLSIYAHFFALYVLLAQAITLVVMKRRHAFTNTRFRVAAWLFAFLVPATVFAVRKGDSAIAWITQPGWRSLLNALVQLVSWNDRPGGVLALVILVGAGCYGSFRAAERWRYGFTSAWFLIPILGSFLLSFLTPMFVTRYLIVALPGLVLSAAAAFAGVKHERWLIVPLALVLATAFIGLPDLYRAQQPEDWRDVAAHVFAEAGTGDRIVFFPAYLQAPFDYYARRVNHVIAESDASIAGRESKRIWFAYRTDDRAGEAAAKGFIGGLGQRYALTQAMTYGELEIGVLTRINV